MDPILASKHQLVIRLFKDDPKRSPYELKRLNDELERLSQIKIDHPRDDITPQFDSLIQELEVLHAKDDIGRKVIVKMIDEVNTLEEIIYLISQQICLTPPELTKLFKLGYTKAENFYKKYALYIKASNKHFGHSTIAQQLVDDLVSIGTLEDWYWLLICQSDTLVSCYDNYDFANLINKQIVYLLETQFFTEITQKMDREIDKIGFIIQRKILPGWQATIDKAYPNIQIEYDKFQIALVLKERENHMIIFTKDLFSNAVKILVDGLNKEKGKYGVSPQIYFSITNE